MTQEIPQEFRDYACRLLGQERYDCFARALAEPPSVSVRLNPFKAIRAGLSPGGLHGADGPVPWASGEGCYLQGRPSFTADPLFHAGAYYVQEASSMFLGQALRQHVSGPAVVLDLCAAPGGKSTHIRSLLPEGSLLVSNEPVKARAQVLLENMTKWGYPDVAVTNAYPQDFARLSSFFDVLVADVPCSGEGMFRKEEAAVEGWSMDNVLMCRDRQRAILRDVWPALKPGGLLVYSTCTLNAYEDEENVAWVAAELGAEVLGVEVAPQWGVVGNLLPPDAVGSFPAYHFIPGFTRGEGFFLAVLRKSADASSSSMGASGRGAGRKRAVARQASSVALPKSCKAWLAHPDGFDFLPDGDGWCAVRSAFASRLEALRRAVKVWQCGIPLAVAKGKDWQPTQALALSTELSLPAFPAVAVSYATAVAYLRKETLSLPSDVPRGFVLLTFQGLPLGFVKNIGGRANNLYPQEWKIRSSHIPEFTVCENTGEDLSAND